MEKSGSSLKRWDMGSSNHGSWKKISLGDVASLQRGHDLPDAERKAGNVPIMGSFGVTGTHSIAKVKGPGVTIGRSGGSIGVVSDIEFDYWPLNTCLYVTDFHGNNPLYVYYLLKTLDLASLNSGSAQPSLNRNFVHPIPVNVPEPDEQEQIVNLLSILDRKIKLNHRMNETLEALAQALFKSWFVDFDPVKAKDEGRKPEGMDDATAALFPPAFTESILGPIPDGWEAIPFSEMIQLIGGGTPKTSVSEYWGGNIPWFSVVDAPSESDVFVINTEKNITQAGLDNSSTKLLPTGTTIITARGTVGRIALVGVPMAMNQSCYGIRGISGIGDFFIYYTTKALLSRLKSITHGSVFDTITRDTFTSVSFVRPSSNIVDRFESHAAPLLKRI